MLAGVPWTTIRARQHIVNEVSQALHKVLVFNNQHNTPFQKWSQGLWHSQWARSNDGEHVCTLYVSIAVPEHKVKFRKGRELGWRSVPEPIKEVLSTSNLDEIQETTEGGRHWKAMAGGRFSNNNPPQTQVGAGQNPFSVLGGEEELSS